MKKPLCLIALAALSGCATAIPAPTTPPPEQIAAQAASLTATGLSPEAYFEAGADLVLRVCHSWFDALVTRSNEYATAAGLSAVGGGLASGLIGIAGSSPAGAIAGMATGATAGVLGALSQSTGIAYPVETGSLVQQAQDAFLAALSPPMTLPEADMDLDAFAGLCSQRGAEALAAQAVAGAQAAPAAGSFSAASIAVTRPRYVPPPRIVAK